MRLHRPIPSTINLAGELLKIWYPSQPKTCRNCGAEDHIARDCDSVRCFNCERPGHRSRDCEEIIYCPVSKGDDHVLAVCPFLVYSANVDVPAEKKDQELLWKTKEERKKRKEVVAQQNAREAEKAARAAGKQSEARDNNNNINSANPTRIRRNEKIAMAAKRTVMGVKTIVMAERKIAETAEMIVTGKDVIVAVMRTEGSAVSGTNMNSGKR